MTTLQHISVALLTVIVVFCTLFALAPSPRDPVLGDHRLTGALVAALAAGAIVMVSL